MKQKRPLLFLEPRFSFLSVQCLPWLPAKERTQSNLWQQLPPNHCTTRVESQACALGGYASCSLGPGAVVWELSGYNAKSHSCFPPCLRTISQDPVDWQYFKVVEELSTESRKTHGESLITMFPIISDPHCIITLLYKTVTGLHIGMTPWQRTLHP